MNKIMTKKCLNPDCSKELLHEDEEYCSNKCYDVHVRIKLKEWTTLSLRVEVRDELKAIRDDLHKKGHKEFGYSDVINAIINLLELIIHDESNPTTVGDFILSNLEELK